MNKKFILYTANTKTVFDSFEEAREAYKSCSENPRFLYQPDKIYFLGTLSSTGYEVGHDHMYHKSVAKCEALFEAKNKNQIKVFLKNNARWHHQGSATRSTKARLYGNGPYGYLYQSNIEDDWLSFEFVLQHYYLSPTNIQAFFEIEDSYGAIDIKIFKGHNPYRLW